MRRRMRRGDAGCGMREAGGGRMDGRTVYRWGGRKPDAETRRRWRLAKEEETKEKEGLGRTLGGKLSCGGRRFCGVRRRKRTRGLLPQAGRSFDSRSRASLRMTEKGNVRGHRKQWEKRRRGRIREAELPEQGRSPVELGNEGTRENGREAEDQGSGASRTRAFPSGTWERGKRERRRRAWKRRVKPGNEGRSYPVSDSVLGQIPT